MRTRYPAAGHESWRPGDQPAPRDFAVRLARPLSPESDDRVPWLTVEEHFVATSVEARALVEAFDGAGCRVEVLERTKTNPGPIGLWRYSLRSHEYVADGSVHLIGYCLECDAHRLLERSLDQVEGWYRQGWIGQDEWEGFTWAWTTSAVRYADYPGWETQPHSHTAREFGERVRELSAEKRRAAGREPVAL